MLTIPQDATNAELSLLSATQNMAMLHSVGLVGQGGKGLGSDVETHRLRQVLVGNSVGQGGKGLPGDVQPHRLRQVLVGEKIIVLKFIRVYRTFIRVY